MGGHNETKNCRKGEDSSSLYEKREEKTSKKKEAKGKGKKSLTMNRTGKVKPKRPL